MKLHSLALVPVGLLLAGTATAQSVLVVDANNGPGTDHTQIQAAIDAAEEGDSLLVRTGSYDPFVVDGKSLTIQADTDALVQVLAGFVNPEAPLLQVRNLGSGQHATIRGVELRASFLGTASTIALVEDNLGTVWIEDLLVTPTFFFVLLPQAALTVEDSTGVTVVRSTLPGSLQDNCGTCGSAPGLRATNSVVSVFDSTLSGSSGSNGVGSPGPTVGGPGALVDGGRAFFSGCTLTGGDGGDAFLGQDGADAGDGIRLIGPGPVVRALGTDFAGGSGGSGNGPGTNAGADGEPSDVTSGSLTLLDGTARTFSTLSPIRAGADSYTETFTGEPGDVVVLAYSLTGPIPGVFLGVAKSDLVVAPPLVLLAKGTLDASGVLTVTPPSTPLGTGLESLQVFLQGAVLSSTGEGVFLTSPGALLLVDPTF